MRHSTLPGKSLTRNLSRYEAWRFASPPWSQRLCTAAGGGAPFVVAQPAAKQALRHSAAQRDRRWFGAEDMQGSRCSPREVIANTALDRTAGMDAVTWIDAPPSARGRSAPSRSACIARLMSLTEGVVLLDGAKDKLGTSTARREPVMLPCRPRVCEQEGAASGVPSGSARVKRTGSFEGGKRASRQTTS